MKDIANVLRETRQAVAASIEGAMPSIIPSKQFGLAACGVTGSFTDEEKSKTSIRKPRLSWRDDPMESRSDWIIVVATSEYESRTYNVHKRIIGGAPRGSKYFKKLFRKEGRHDRLSRTTKIELDEQDAQSFPLLLDFMYSIEGFENDEDSISLATEDGITTNNATSLRHLARIFDCEACMLAVNKFIQGDLSLRTAPKYLYQAALYHDDRLIDSSKQFCVDNFSNLETKAITKLPLKLFRTLITAVAKRSRSSSNSNVDSDNGEALSFQLSEVVCQYFEKHPEVLSVDLLLELTDESIIPRIASEPAVGFTALLRELDPNDVPADSKEWDGIVDLSQRCARAVVRSYGWEKFNVMSALDEYVHGPCGQQNNKIDSLLFATSFAAALEQAQMDTGLENSGSNNRHRNYGCSRATRRDDHDVGLDDKNELEQYKTQLGDTKEELKVLQKQVRDLQKKRGHR